MISQLLQQVWMHCELVIKLSVDYVSTKKVCAVVCSLCTTVTVARLLRSVSLIDRGTISVGGKALGMRLRVRYGRYRCLESWLGGCRITNIIRKADTLCRCWLVSLQCIWWRHNARSRTWVTRLLDAASLVLDCCGLDHAVRSCRQWIQAHSGGGILGHEIAEAAIWWIASCTAVRRESLYAVAVRWDLVDHARVVGGLLVIDNGKHWLPVVRVLTDGAASVGRGWLDRISDAITIHLVKTIVGRIWSSSWLSLVLHLACAANMIQNLVVRGLAALVVLLRLVISAAGLPLVHLHLVVIVFALRLPSME